MSVVINSCGCIIYVMLVCQYLGLLLLVCLCVHIFYCTCNRVVMAMISDLLHFCSNSDGSVLSVDKLTGRWVE